MADTRTVSQGSLNQLASAVDTLSDSARQVRSVVIDVDGKAKNLGEDINTVQNEFKAFREFDEQQKELAKAKTEIVNVRQQVQAKFGINDTVRQYLTGILEASDLSLVRQNVIENCTERMMLSCPTYWLAPCLVAVAAWLGDNRELANKALQEAIKRDDEKTSLLFALVCRRVGRMNASAVWLERYLAVQDPHKVERKMVTVLDAYSNGFFGPQSREICAKKIENWITELSEEPGFIEEQQKSWEDSMMSMVPGNGFSSKYPYSAKRCTNWGAATQSLNETSLHQILLDYFKGIFEKPTASTASLNKQLDDLLENYTSSYDNEELPLRRQERMLELIIEERGKKARAEARFNAEQKALDEVFDFTQLLTSAAMHADLIKASNATQRLAIALSKDWVTSAFSNVQMKVRQHIPSLFEIDIEGWKNKITDGSEEESLCTDADHFFTQKRDQEISAVVQSKLDIILPIVVGVVGIIALFSSPTWGIIALLAAAGLGLRWHLNKKKCEKTKQGIRERYDRIIKDVKETIRALCAERVDYIADVKEKESISSITQDYLNSIEVGQYVSTGKQRLTLGA